MFTGPIFEPLFPNALVIYHHLAQPDFPLRWNPSVLLLRLFLEVIVYFNFFLLKDVTENSLIFLLCWNQNSYESEANSELHSSSAIFGWYVPH